MLIQMLLRTFTQGFRVMRNFIARPFRLLASKMRYMTNIGRYLAKLNTVFTAIPRAIMKKPKERKDYVSVGNVFMAKIFVILLVIALIVLPVLFYLYVWPMLVPRFFTAKFTIGDTKLDGYGGKVRIFYDDAKKQPMFEGRLLDGSYTDRGTLYYENGFVMYNGAFAEGMYDGFGKLYAEDARLVYEGDFSKGLYHGRGTLYGGSGTAAVYTGLFENGLYHGPGQTFDEAGVLIYNGNFEYGEYSGRGRLYVNGALRYEGDFQAGVRSGMGTEYGAGGSAVYRGGFADGVYNGIGVMYGAAGETIYEGGFAAGLFSGEGALVMPDGYAYEGSFGRGAADGFGRLSRGGALIYSGDFENGLAQGNGALTDRAAGFAYSGQFERGMIAPGALLSAAPASIYGAFEPGVREYHAENEFYLYNAAFGIALRIEYADIDNPDNPARVTHVYIRPEATLPRVGGDLGDGGVTREAYAAPDPDYMALSLIETRIPGGARAVREIRGTVLVTLWLSDGGEETLYIFETADGATGTAAGGGGSGFASREHYLEFGLEEIAPAA